VLTVTPKGEIVKFVQPRVQAGVPIGAAGFGFGGGEQFPLDNGGCPGQMQDDGSGLNFCP
jgi:hypothetical protein